MCPAAANRTGIDESSCQFDVAPVSSAKVVAPIPSALLPLRAKTWRSSIPAQNGKTEEPRPVT